MAARRGSRRVRAQRPQKKFPSKPLAERILSEVDERRLWKELLQSKDLRLRLNALKYMTDRRDGRPPHAVSLEGEGGFRVVLDEE